ncbi:MAG: DUF748 domain-containing protein [Gammaproteobacteria bacterium]|nr:DUF748 domain-containing protein [Gammaproteobacteria bacterium]
MSKKLWLSLLFIAVLVMLRAALPGLTCQYINHRLNQVQGYSGQVQSVSLSLLSLKASIHQLSLEKDSPTGTKPIISIQTISITLDGLALVQGRTETNLILDQPNVHFIAEAPASKTESETTATQAWQLSMQQLLPLKIDTIVIHNGTVHYQNRIEQPEFDISLNNIEATLSGLQQAPTDAQPLPAYLHVDAKAFNQAAVFIYLHFNPQASTPTFKLEASMENLQLNQLDDFLQHYTKLQAKTGTFNFYLEAAAKDNKITGYIKPYLMGVKLKVPPEDQHNSLKKAYKSVVQTATKILKNNDTANVATKLDLSGDIDDPDASIWSTVVNLLQNAFLQALLPGIDHSIQF